MDWSFTAAWPTMVAGGLVLAITTWLWVANRRRARGRRGIALLETLRWATVALIVVTLWQPELVRPMRRDEPPVVAVVIDASRSMETADVLDTDAIVRRRADVAQALVTAKFWGAMSNQYRVVVEQFSARPDSAHPPAVEEGTDLNAALEGTLIRHRRLRAVVLLTDGDWNTGKAPVAAATRLRLADVPVFAVAVGSREYLPDLALEKVAAPAYGLVGEPIVIPFRVRSHLPREVKTRVMVREGGETVASREIVIPPRGTAEDALFWTPTRAGALTPVVSLPAEVDEVRDDNNEQALRVDLRREVLRVLVVESVPRWEYRYLRNALQRDPGVEVRTLLLHPGLGPGDGRDYLKSFPRAKDELAAYDVVFLGDVGIGSHELTTEDAALLRGLVEQQGSGLVFLPGRRGRQLTLADTPLGELLPVELDASQVNGVRTVAPARLALTQRGRGHLLTMLVPPQPGVAQSESENDRVWRALPGFYWHAAVRKARPGAEVVAVHEGARNAWGRLPLLVTRPQGNGRVLFMGVDSAWRWRRGVEDVYHYRLWGQVVRWMSYQRHVAAARHLRVFFTPENPQRGDTVQLHATVLGANGMPAAGGVVTADVTAPGGRTERLTLREVDGGWGLYTGEATVRERGAYRVAVRSATTETAVTTELTVQGEQREQVGRPAQVDVLREIAQITGGRLGRAQDVPELMAAVAALPEAQPQELRLRLWCHPLWCGALIGLLAAYWIGRKLAGLV